MIIAFKIHLFVGLAAQDCGNSIINALELPQSRSKVIDTSHSSCCIWPESGNRYGGASNISSCFDVFWLSMSRLRKINWRCFLPVIFYEFTQRHSRGHRNSFMNLIVLALKPEHSSMIRSKLQLLMLWLSPVYFQLHFVYFDSKLAEACSQDSEYAAGHYLDRR